MSLAAPKGLSYVPQLGAALPPQGEALRFRGAGMVQLAAALFDNQPTWDGGEGRSFAVVVSAGTVGVVMRDPARAERRNLSGLGDDLAYTRELIAPRFRLLEGEEGELWFQREGEPEWREREPSRRVVGWSRRSRARMTHTLAQLDWSPMYVEGRPAAMLTLTYPGEWLEVVPTGKQAKRHLQALWRRWERKWGAPFVGPWKLEFQDRGAPHFHLLAVPPDVEPAVFAGWLSSAWAQVVGAAWCGIPCWELPGPACCERGRHMRAGSGVDYLYGSRCFDPKRAAVYFSKHGGAAGGKEYQHTVPEAWQEPGAGPGRFWGYRGLEKVTASAPLDVVAYTVARRTLRRWSQSRQMTRRRVVDRVELSTGRVRKRRVTRRARYLGHGGLAGGTILFNDGPAVAADLARYLAQRSGSGW